ncbi:hypothetical protein V8C86DRAFT_2775449 [Haematococcus lacustris]
MDGGVAAVGCTPCGWLGGHGWLGGGEAAGWWLLRAQRARLPSGPGGCRGPGGLRRHRHGGQQGSSGSWGRRAHCLASPLPLGSLMLAACSPIWALASPHCGALGGEGAAAGGGRRGRRGPARGWTGTRPLGQPRGWAGNIVVWGVCLPHASAFLLLLPHILSCCGAAPGRWLHAVFHKPQQLCTRAEGPGPLPALMTDLAYAEQAHCGTGAHCGPSPPGGWRSCSCCVQPPHLLTHLDQAQPGVTDSEQV